MTNLPVTRLRHFGRRGLIIVGFAVALPAVALAVMGGLLAVRIAREVHAESARYNAYLAEKVSESFERELLDQVRDATTAADRLARAGAGSQQILAALATRSQQFESPHFVPVSELNGYSVAMAGPQLLVYGMDPAGRHPHPFAAVLLRDERGEVVGAGGWWFNPRAFVAANLANVVQQRLTSDPRLYGGISLTRYLAVLVQDEQDHEVAHLRTPYAAARTGREAPMTGPFEGFRVSIVPTDRSPVVAADRFMTIELSLIGLMALSLLAAMIVGLRHVRRQIELVQMQSNFMANVTHELKTPVAVIRLGVETLEMGRYRTPGEQQKYLRTITRETERLAHLVDNILDFSRLESGRQGFRFAPVALADVVENAIESMRLRLEDAGFQWVVEVPPDLPPARADMQALQHCLLNLLDNAMKYSRQRREIRITAGQRDGMLTLGVVDRGIGIDAANQKRIFEKFVRVEAGLVHDVKGAGLGLSLVDQIMRAHHGRVDVQSSPGEGSTFTLVLPPWGPGSGS